MATFDEVWSWLQDNLKPSQTIKNWSVIRGDLGRTVTVVCVCSGCIEVDPPKAKNIQVVPKQDFKKVWDVWSAYKSGELFRSTIPEKTRYVTYILSILHYYEQEVTGNA